MIVYIDYHKYIDEKMAGVLYIGFFLMTLVRYLMLMNNIVNQITTHMGLRFLLVKPKSQTKQEWLIINQDKHLSDVMICQILSFKLSKFYNHIIANIKEKMAN